MNKIFVKIDKLPKNIQFVILILIYIFVIGITLSILLLLVYSFVYIIMGNSFLLNH